LPLLCGNIDLPMLKIELSKLQFHGYHGVHEEESKAGGDFEVNLVVYFQPVSLPVRHLNETIDYTQLYALVKLRMERPTRLLETLATEIADEIFKSFQAVEELEVSIKKLNPPIPFFHGSVAASYAVKRPL
jgi:dihydroneopterin aldolase